MFVGPRVGERVGMLLPILWQVSYVVLSTDHFSATKPLGIAASAAAVLTSSASSGDTHRRSATCIVVHELFKMALRPQDGDSGTP
jgi:hypothetical protein